MDKFDEQIQNAKETYEPKSNFVENTMEQIPTQKPPRRWNPKVWIPSLAGVGAVAVIIIAFIAWPKSPTHSAAVSGQGSAGQSSQASSSVSPAAVAGADDASLNSDLNNIQSSMNQSSSDQSSADNAVNDNTQQISVPTD